MQMNVFFTSPLEQFVVNPVFVPYFLEHLGLSFTNQSILLVFILFFLSVFMNSLLKPTNSTYYIIPANWQGIIEQLNLLVLSLAVDNIKDKNAQYFIPLLYFTFFFILSLNLFGLIPYSFTLTSHIIVTLAMALMLFLGINIIGAQKHGLHFFSLFLPPGTSIALAFLLVPIELISFVFKPISLSIRLFANMMAGHTLLKVIAGFGYTLMGFGGILFFLHFFPLLILIPLFALEFGVALIQTFVFSILICIYINDAINLH